MALNFLLVCGLAPRDGLEGITLNPAHSLYPPSISRRIGDGPLDFHIIAAKVPLVVACIKDEAVDEDEEEEEEESDEDEGSTMETHWDKHKDRTLGQLFSRCWTPWRPKAAGRGTCTGMPRATEREQ